MYARVATFESDPAKVDDAVALVRAEVDGEVPPGLEGAKMLMLVNRETGKAWRDAVRDGGCDAAGRRGPQRDEPRLNGAPRLCRLLRGTSPDCELRVSGRAPERARAWPGPEAQAVHLTRERLALAGWWCPPRCCCALAELSRYGQGGGRRFLWRSHTSGA